MAIHQDLLDGRVYYDDHLFYDGAGAGRDRPPVTRMERTRIRSDAHYRRARSVERRVRVIDVFGGKLWPCD